MVSTMSIITSRNMNGSWGGWSPVGINVGATSIAAVTLNNRPDVSMLNTAGSIYQNARNSNRSWAGWFPVGAWDQRHAGRR